MSNRRRKEVEANKRRRRTVLFTFGFLVMIYMLLVLVFGEQGLLKYLKLKSVRDDFQLRIDAIGKQKDEIEEEIDVVKSEKDLTVMEELAREHGYMKEGEIVFQYLEE